jgi:hypothetical protein
MPISLLSWSPNAATGATEAGKCPPAMENPPKVRVEILKYLRSCATSQAASEDQKPTNAAKPWPVRGREKHRKRVLSIGGLRIDYIWEYVGFRKHPYLGHVSVFSPPFPDATAFKPFSDMTP